MINADFVSIFKTISNDIFKNDPKIKKYVILNSYLHFLKINSFILFICLFYFNLIRLFSYLFGFKNFAIQTSSNKLKILRMVGIVFFLLKIKVYELIFSLIIIQSRLPKEISEKKFDSNFDKNKSNLIYEAIVIGSGPGGSITSYYLNKVFNSKVLLLEQGQHYEIYKNKHPAKEFLTKWNNGGVNTTFFPKMISFASGNCFGGGSEINSGLYHEPDQSFIESWQNDFRVKNLDKNILDKKLEELFSICSATENLDNIGIPDTDHFLKGCRINNFMYEKLKSFHNFDKIIKKKSMSKTFLKKYENENGKYLCNHKVLKIIKDKNHWKVLINNRGKKSYFITKRIFLCAGSIYTPFILKKSNIKLEQSISNFKFHPMIKLIAKFPYKVQNGKENVHPFQITEFFPDFIIGNASSGKEFMDLNFYNKDFSTKINNDWENKLIYHVTYSFGKGNFFSNFDYPLATYNIENHNLDLIKKSLFVACKFLYDSGATQVQVLNKKPIVLSPEEYKKMISKIKLKDLKFSAVHILGGLKSGEGEECNLDSFGKVKGQNNLYVNDSSIINHKLLKNPQGIIMAVAKRNIDNFLDNEIN